MASLDDYMELLYARKKALEKQYHQQDVVKSLMTYADSFDFENQTPDAAALMGLQLKKGYQELLSDKKEISNLDEKFALKALASGVNPSIDESAFLLSPEIRQKLFPYTGLAGQAFFEMDPVVQSIIKPKKEESKDNLIDVLKSYFE